MPNCSCRDLLTLYREKSCWSMAKIWPTALLFLLGAAKAASQPKISKDLVRSFADAEGVNRCGRSAFAASGQRVCEDIDIEAMIPVGLLWLNCEHDVAGVVMFPCRSPRWLPMKENPISCLSKLSSHEFLRMMNFAVRAFDVCSKVVRHHRTANIRTYMGQLVSTAWQSITSQREIREVVERLVQSSDMVLVVQERTWEVLTTLRTDTDDALRAARSLAHDVTAAKMASARVHSEVKSLGKSLMAGTKQASEVAQAMSDELETVIEEFGKSQPRLRRTLQRRAILLSLSIVEAAALMVLFHRGVIPSFAVAFTFQVIGLAACHEQARCFLIQCLLQGEAWGDRSTSLRCLLFTLCMALPLTCMFVMYPGIDGGDNFFPAGSGGICPIQDELDRRSEHESRASSSCANSSDAASSNRSITRGTVSS
jgi:hypothetical protein